MMGEKQERERDTTHNDASQNKGLRLRLGLVRVEGGLRLGWGHVISMFTERKRGIE